MAGKLSIVFLDASTFGDVSLKRFSENWNCAVHKVTAPAEVAERLRGRDVVILNKVVLDGALLDSAAAKDLKMIAIAATGTDNVDLEAARARGITVCNVPGYAAQSVAQFTMALILELATRVGGYGELVRAGAWEKSPIYTLLEFPSFELAGKSLGIVGYGNIGRRVAEMARGFGLEILIAARPGSDRPVPQGRLPLDEVLKRSDIISLHCPLTPRTRNLLDSRALALMKPGALLINTARGTLIDAEALIQALRGKRLAGAALDVLTQEPPPPDHPLIQAAKELDNLLVTPHCAWSAREARERLMDEVVENILAFTRGQDRNRVA
ncbi:MAG: D-2-hydroxyacid dehydrogenase [Deltaproteobacteria bacterium]|nr:D-2-hydroxyacid dehydrogenase [Deltaproteobacteria bacterium]MBI2539169.1 D-2-hydroxyacid dehydrogenase [Deltaproteobacteria bacterium]